MQVGDEISVYAELQQAGPDIDDDRGRGGGPRTRRRGEEFEVATGDFTFVALDDNDRPRAIAAKEENNG